MLRRWPSKSTCDPTRLVRGGVRYRRRSSRAGHTDACLVETLPAANVGVPRYLSSLSRATWAHSSNTLK
jgi:hypothetical protein